VSPFNLARRGGEYQSEVSLDVKGDQEEEVAILNNKKDDAQS